MYSLKQSLNNFELNLQSQRDNGGHKERRLVEQERLPTTLQRGSRHLLVFMEQSVGIRVDCCEEGLVGR
jgi:hypothetical protein